MDSIAKLLLTWLGNPVRGLATVMIAAVIAFALHPVHWFSATAADPLWRWPLLALLISASALITYPVEKEWKRRNQIKEEHQREDQRLKQLSETLIHLSPGEKQILRNFISAMVKVKDLESYGETASLVHKNLLVQVGEIALGFSYYRISDDIWAYLQKNPDSLN